MTIIQAREKINAICTNIEKVMVGKRPEIELALVAMAAGGHILLEDAPGTGKTTLAKAIATSISGDFKRIQFTPDLLPSDITGINAYNPKTGEFSFRKGGVFTHILLADEINRATPRTQSGLLECMEEYQISIDGQTHKLERPFFVIATQNPIEAQGTFPLPEAQLDRFIMQISIGYPSTDGEANIISRFLSSNPLQSLTPVTSILDWLQIQDTISSVSIHQDLCTYIANLAQHTRKHEHIAIGVSPRASIALARASQAYAAVNGRDFVTPEDIKYLAPYVWAHRLTLRSTMRTSAKQQIITSALQNVPVPTEEMM